MGNGQSLGSVLVGEEGRPDKGAATTTTTTAAAAATTAVVVAPSGPGRVRALGSDLMERIKTAGVEGLIREYDKFRFLPAHFLPCTAYADHKDRNRYTDIACFDHTRVKLQEPTVLDSGKITDYIHANFVAGPVYGEREFICTQGPLKATFDDFWKMVWEQNVLVIVMLCLNRENGKTKCDEYYEKEAGKEKAMESGLVAKTRTVAHVTEGEHQLVEMTLEITTPAAPAPRTLIQILHTNWPDRSLPPGSATLVALARRVRSHHSRLTASNGMEPSASPKLVHCSAGVGRTGTFIAIDTAIATLEPPPEKPSQPLSSLPLDIATLVTAIRSQRRHAVQNTQQYLFIYLTVAEFIAEKIPDLAIDLGPLKSHLATS